MSWTYTGVTDQISGLPVYRNSDDGDCYIYGSDGFDWIGNCPNVSGAPATPVPTYPVGGGGGIIQPGGSWYNDLLNTILGLSALGSHGSISATGINQPITNPYPYGGGQYPVGYNPNVGNGQGLLPTAGSSIGTFIQKNGTMLLIGVGVYLLYNSGRKK